jgi:EF hand
MKETLSAQEFTRFQETLNRPPRLADARGRRGAADARGRQGPNNRGLTVDQIVERLMSFDKNGDGKVTKDELPERMQNLIARGDSDKDGALDKDEIKKLAADLAADRAFGPFANRGGLGGRQAGADRRGGPPVGFGGNVARRALDDLNLADAKKTTAETAVKAYQDNTRKLVELARADLLLKMSDVLNEEELKSFKASLNRQPGFGVAFGGRGGPFGGPPPRRPTSESGDLEKKLDQLQKDLDNLRREIRR